MLDHSAAWGGAAGVASAATLACPSTTRDAGLFGGGPNRHGDTAVTSTSSLPRPMPPRAYLAVIRAIDAFTEWTGYLFVLLIVPLIMANVIEVFARHVLKDPTIWALDVTTMSYAALFMLGSALALLKGAHVRTDM